MRSARLLFTFSSMVALLGIALTPAFAAGAAHSAGPPDAVLSADDECTAEEAATRGAAGTDPPCGISALQIRARRAQQLHPQPLQGTQMQPKIESVGAQPAHINGGDSGHQKNYPPLCAPEIVATTCESVNHLAPEFFGSDADLDTRAVHAAEIAEMLMVSRKSVRAFFRDYLRLNNVEVDPEALSVNAFAVTCADLCNRTVASILDAHRPPFSDLACYVPYGSPEPQCDIDVSSASLGGFVFDDHNPQEAKSKYAESPTLKLYLEFLIRSGHPNTTEMLRQLREKMYPDKTPQQLTIAIANLFRVYPLVQIEVLDLTHQHVSDVAASTIQMGSKSNGTSSSGSTVWRDKVQMVNAKAQAYTAGALRNINSGSARNMMVKWFGATDPSSQQEMRRVINGVHSLLSNVDYVYPGSQCRSNVFAYVFPNPPNNRDSRGHYIFHLCDLYMTSSLQEQVETLTHEGSHHQTMRTDDVCYSGTGSSCLKAYGRTVCAKLAREAPSKALKNADNYCFFINDAYEGGGGGDETFVPVPASSPSPPPFRSTTPRPSPAYHPTVPPWMAPWLPHHTPAPGVTSPALTMPPWMSGWR